MKKLIILLAALTVSVSSFAQGTINSPVVKFDKLSLSGNIQLTLAQGEDNGFTCNVENTTTDKLEWSFKDGLLSFKLKQPLSFSKDTPKPAAKITLTFTNFQELETNGVTVLSDGDLEIPLLTINASSKSYINLTTSTRDLTINATNSVVTINGASEFINIKASAGASINTVNADIENANVLSQTNAEVYVKASKRLEAKATSNANVFYSGTPEILKTSKSSFGAVSPMGSKQPIVNEVK